MINLDLIMPLDFILFYRDTISAMKDRTREYGLRRALFVKNPTMVGIVLELYDEKFLFFLENNELKLEPIENILPNITKVYRHWVYTDKFQKYSLERSLMKAYKKFKTGDKSLIEVIGNLSNGNKSTALIYICTAASITYPEGFTNFKMKLKDIFTPLLGYTEVSMGVNNGQ